MYGITETTVHVTYRALSEADTSGGRGSEIGRPLADLQVHLLDGRLEALAGIAISAADSHVMLCGNPDMITETREILHARGLRPNRRAVPGNFLAENYW